MNIEFLKKLRTLIATGGVIVSTAFLTGCGVETADFGQTTEVESEKNNGEDVLNAIPSEYLNDRGKFNKHDHFVINIGGVNYIIRQCDPASDEISIGYNGTYIDYKISDLDNNSTLIDGRSADYTKFDVDSYESELSTQELENVLIENGARLYKGLGN